MRAAWILPLVPHFFPSNLEVPILKVTTGGCMGARLTICGLLHGAGYHAFIQNRPDSPRPAGMPTLKRRPLP